MLNNISLQIVIVKSQTLKKMKLQYYQKNMILKLKRVSILMMVQVQVVQLQVFLEELQHLMKQEENDFKMKYLVPCLMMRISVGKVKLCLFQNMFIINQYLLQV